MPSFARYTANGSTDTFSVPFPFLNRAHVVVRVDGSTLSSGAYTWPTNSTIKITAGAPASGLVVEVSRRTPATPLYSYTWGNINPNNLNKSFLQSLYLAEEGADIGTDARTRAWLAPNFGSGGRIFPGTAGALAVYTAADRIGPSAAVTEAYIVDIRDDLNAEALARVVGDNNLQGRINDEAATRQSEDQALLALIQSAVPASNFDFDSRGVAASLAVPSTRLSLTVAGYTSPGDGGAAAYKRVSSGPASISKFQSADGGWWELAEDIWTPQMLGIRADGETSVSGLLAQMFAEAPTGKRITFLPGTYVLTSTVTIPRGVVVDARGADFFVKANVLAFYATSAPTISSLSSDYVNGSLSVSVSAMAAALPAGTPFKIVSDAVDPANRDGGSSAAQYRVGEWSHVTSGSTTTALALSAPLRFPRGVNPVSAVGEEGRVDAYRTTYNARVLVLSGETLSWTGGRIRYEEGHEADWKAGAFLVEGFTRPEVDGLAITKGYSIGLSLKGNYCATVRRMRAANLTNNTGNGQFGYGVADASYGTVVEGCDFENVRHGYTTAADGTVANEQNWSLLISSGRTMGARISKCIGYGGNAGPFDTHHDAEDVTFTNCVVLGSGSHAFGVRGRNVVLDGCAALNCRYGAIIFTEYAGGDPDDDTFVSGKPEGATTAELRNFTAKVSELPLDVSCVRSLRVIGADLQSANHRMIRNAGSSILLGGEVRCLVTTFDGSKPITESTNTGIFEVQDLPSQLAPSADWAAALVYAAGAMVQVDATQATDAANNLWGFKTQSAANLVENRGRIRMALPNTVFAGLLTGPNASYSATPDSAIEVSVASAADNSVMASVVGKALVVSAVDGTGWWDGTGVPNAVERFASRNVDVNVTHAGTGAFVEDVCIPPMPQIKQMDAAGHYFKLVVKAVKTGSAGVASFRARLGGGFVVDMPVAATDVIIEFVFEVFVRGDNSQRVFVTGTAGNGGSSPAVQRQWGTMETSDLAAAGHGISIGVSAAVGDTIKFETYTLHSTVAGLGV